MYLFFDFLNRLPAYMFIRFDLKIIFHSLKNINAKHKLMKMVSAANNCG